MSLDSETIDVSVDVIPVDSIPANYPELKQVFSDWWNQGADRPPTNGDIVKYDKIDTTILQHLATFVWTRAKKV